MYVCVGKKNVRFYERVCMCKGKSNIVSLFLALFCTLPIDHVDHGRNKGQNNKLNDLVFAEGDWEKYITPIPVTCDHPAQ